MENGDGRCLVLNPFPFLSFTQLKVIVIQLSFGALIPENQIGNKMGFLHVHHKSIL
jgi:hypothetical protein